MMVRKIVLFLAIIISATAINAFSAGTSSYNVTTDIISPDYGGGQPAVGTTTTDANTGAGIVRLSDISTLTGTDDALVVYSRFTPTNSTGQYILVHGTNSKSSWIVRLSDNAVLHKVNPGPNVGAENDEIGEDHEIRWDYSGSYPNRIYFVYGMKFYQMDVIDGNDTSTLLHDFSVDYPAGVSIMNDVEGDSSGNSRYWAWMVMGQTIVGGRRQPDVYIVYDKQTDSIVGDFLPSDTANYTTYLYRPNMVEMSPLGTKVIIGNGIAKDRPFTFPGAWINDGGGIYHMVGYKAYSADNNVFSYVRNDGVDLIYKDGGTIGSITGAGQYSNNSASDTIWVRLGDDSDPTGHTIAGNWGARPWDDETVLDGAHAFDLDFTNPVKVSITEGHSGWAFDSSGKEVFVSQDDTRDKVQACWIDGTGGEFPNNCIDVLDHLNDLGYTNMHFGKFYNSNQRGWFLMSTYDDDNTQWSKNQIFMVELDSEGNDPTVWRISPTYNQYAGNYRDEASAALGYDGTSVYWTGNWGNASTGHREVYRVGLPNDWLVHFGGDPPPDPVCDSSHLNLCNSGNCAVAGGNWCTDVCQLAECSTPPSGNKRMIFGASKITNWVN